MDRKQPLSPDLFEDCKDCIRAMKDLMAWIGDHKEKLMPHQISMILFVTGARLLESHRRPDVDDGEITNFIEDAIDIGIRAGREFGWEE